MERLKGWRVVEVWDEEARQEVLAIGLSKAEAEAYAQKGHVHAGSRLIAEKDPDSFPSYDQLEGEVAKYRDLYLGLLKAVAILEDFVDKVAKALSETDLYEILKKIQSPSGEKKTIGKIEKAEFRDGKLYLQGKFVEICKLCPVEYCDPEKADCDLRATFKIFRETLEWEKTRVSMAEQSYHEAREEAEKWEKEYGIALKRVQEINDEKEELVREILKIWRISSPDAINPILSAGERLSKIYEIADGRGFEDPLSELEAEKEEALHQVAKMEGDYEKAARRVDELEAKLPDNEPYLFGQIEHSRDDGLGWTVYRDEAREVWVIEGAFEDRSVRATFEREEDGEKFLRRFMSQ